METKNDKISFESEKLLVSGNKIADKINLNCGSESVGLCWNGGEVKGVLGQKLQITFLLGGLNHIFTHILITF